MLRSVLLCAIPCVYIAAAGCSPAKRHDSEGEKPMTRPSAIALADNVITDQFTDVPEGYEVRLWAKTPHLFNPTNIDTDARGRIFVAEGVNYRETWKKQNALSHPDGDRIVILEDTDGDGACDSSKVFVQDKDLLCPLGVAVMGNSVVVSCSPNLIVYTDTDGDDKADKKEILLTGFGGRDHDHGLHAVTGGVDGKWYFNAGNDGPHEVQDRSGWWLHSGSCYVYGPTGNTGNRVSDDGRIWTGGVALRVDPDGKNLVPLGHNFRNSYEISRDSFGTMWQSDNDDDGNRGCRFSWLPEGGNMGFFSADGTRAWGADKRPGQDTLTAHWHQDDPGVFPLQENTGAGGPTGVAVYEGGVLPKAMIGSVLDCDAGRDCIWAQKPVADGAGYKFERSTLIAAKIPTTNPAERANWFRPSDVMVGIDGAIYIADWYDPGVGGHDIKDKGAEGRILRLAPKGTPAKGKPVDLKSFDGQLAALNNPAVNIRYAAALKLREQADKSIPKLRALLDGKDTIQRARVVTLLAQMGDQGQAEARRALLDRDDAVAVAAFRALRVAGDPRKADPQLVADARTLMGRPSPAVKREVALAMRDVPFDQCRDILLTLMNGYDGHDRFFLEAVGLACDRKEPQAYELLLSHMPEARQPLKWSDSMAGLAWRLHPPAAIEAFAIRANAEGLSPAARMQALTALAFINDEKAAEAVDKLRLAGPAHLRPTAEWWLKLRGGADWKDYAIARHATVTAIEATAEKKPKATSRRVADLARLTDMSLPKGQREVAAGRLAKEPEGAMALIAMAGDGKFPEELKPAVTAVIYGNPDLAVRAMASTYFPRAAAGGVKLPPVKELAQLPGDASRGKAVFYGNTASCSRCHAFNGDGKDVGPDLTSIRTKYQRPELLDAVLNPSASIAFGYEPWIIQVTGGDVYSGFILADAENVTIKESTGEQRIIPKAKIKKRVKQPMSVMPDNVGMGLTAQELADVAEFLLKSPVKPATTQSAQK